MASPLETYFSFQRPRGNIDQLDGLRAFAMTMIFWSHLIQPYWKPGVTFWHIWGPVNAANWAYNVWYSLQIFFALTGFLMTSSLIRKLQGNRADLGVLKKYFSARALRILPCYIVMVLLTATGVFYKIDATDLPRSLFYHFLFLQDYTGSDISPSYWAMGLEVKYYITIPLLILTLIHARLWRWRYWIVGAIFLSAPLIRWLTPLDQHDLLFTSRTIYTEDYGTLLIYVSNHFRVAYHLCFDDFTAGTFIALLWHDREKFPRFWSAKATRIMFYLGVLGFVVSASLVQPNFLTLTSLEGGSVLVPPLNQVYLQTYISVCMFLVFIGILGGHGPQRLLKSRVGMVIAHLSFCFYLVHLAMIRVWFHLLCTLAGAPTVVSIYFWWFFPTYLVGSYILSMSGAILLHFFVEKPFLVIKRAPKTRGENPAP